MSKLIGEKLLKVWFLESEWKALSQNESFMDGRAKADTIDDFHRLCIFGSGLVSKGRKLQDISRAGSADFLLCRPTEEIRFRAED